MGVTLTLVLVHSAVAVVRILFCLGVLLVVDAGNSFARTLAKPDLDETVRRALSSVVMWLSRIDCD